MKYVNSGNFNYSIYNSKSKNSILLNFLFLFLFLFFNVSCYFNVNVKSKNSTGSSIQFSVSNITTGYLLINISNSSQSVLSGTCPVDGAIISSTLSFNSAVVCQNGQWSGVIDASSLADGSGSTTVTENSIKNSTPIVVPYIKKTTTPTMTFSSPAQNSIITINNYTSFAVSGVCDDPGGLIHIRIDGTAATEVNCQNNQTWNGNLNFSNATQGSHAITATFYDRVGNPSSIHTKNYTLHTTTSTVQHVTASNANGVYKANDTLTIQIKTSSPVYVNTGGGAPRLELNFHPQLKYAQYSSGSGTDLLSFTTTISSGEGVLLLNYVATNSLSLNGGSILNVGEVPLNLTLPLLSGGSDLGTLKTISVDTLPPYAEVESGLPIGVNLVNNLNLTIRNLDVYEYRYGVGETASIDCSNISSYGPWTLQTTPISTSIAGLSAGSITLCLIGRDLAQNEQALASATTYSWVRGLTPPSGLTYSQSTVVYTVGQSIVANIPSFSAGTKPFTFTVLPSLPNGLLLNSQTGVISGTPTTSNALTTYTITATNVNSQSTSTTVDIEVLSSSNFSITNLNDQQSVSGYQVLSGSCTNGKTILLTLPSDAEIPPGGSSSVVCSNSQFHFDMTFKGTPGPRHVQITQESQVLTRSLYYNPSGLASIVNGANNLIKAAALDSTTGKIYIGGSFTVVQNERRYYLARLHSDGSLDTSFNLSGSGFNNSINCINYDPTEQKLYVGGDFTSYNGVTRRYIARLNSDGSLDTSFTESGSGLNQAAVFDLIYDSTNQKLYIGGSFTSYNSTSRLRVARLNHDGTLDMGYDTSSGFNNTVYALALDSTNNKLYVGGQYDLYSSTSRRRIARLNSDGSLDIGFVTSTFGLDNIVYALAYDSAQQKIYAGGSFLSHNNYVTKYLAKFNSDGSIDTSFFPTGSGLNNMIWSLTFDSTNQKLYAGGVFSSFNGQSLTSGVARFNPNGTLDSNFINPYGGFNSSIYKILLDQANQKVLAFGDHKNIGTQVQYAATRLKMSDGQIDPSFNSKLRGFSNPSTFNPPSVSAILWEQNSEKIYVGGNFTYYNGIPRRYIARFNKDGSLDLTFSPPGTGFSDEVTHIVYDSLNQKIIIAGNFKSFNGITKPNLLRLNLDGTLDSSFGPSTGQGFNDVVATLYYDSINNKLYAGGIFTYYDSKKVGKVVRLLNNGGLDNTFNLTGTGYNGNIYDITMDPTTQKIFVAGSYSQYDSVAIKNLTRLNTNGTLDVGFTASGGSTAGGINSGVNSVSYDNTNQKVYIAGYFSNYNSYFARLNSDGSLDTNFYPEGSGFGSFTNKTFYDSINQKVYIMGYFSDFNGLQANGIVRLNSNGTRDFSFSPSGIGFDSVINAFALNTVENKIYLGGAFNSYDSTLTRSMAWIKTDGSLINAGLNVTAPSLSVSPNATLALSTSGGTSPYTYSVYLGGGSIDQNTGLYTAPSTSGRAIIEVRDSSSPSLSSQLSINIYPTSLSITPSPLYLHQGDSQLLGVNGGVLPYSFQLLSGLGTVNGSGIFTAPSDSASLSVVKVIDTMNTQQVVSIHTLETLQIIPSKIKITGEMSTSFTASGGRAPYTYGIVSGEGTINQNTGFFTTTNRTGQARISVTDSLGYTSYAIVEVSGVSHPLTLLPSSLSLSINSSYGLSAIGGSGTYSYNVTSGGGSITQQGLFTAPGTSGGTSVVQVSDGTNTAQISISITSAFTLTPTSANISMGQTLNFSATGGTPPYQFAVTQGLGSIDTNGNFTPSQLGLSKIKVVDSAKQVQWAQVQVNDHLQLTSTAQSVPRLGQIKIEAINGVAPYTYSIVSGGGSLSLLTATSGPVNYLAPSSSATAILRVTDSNGQTKDLTLPVTSIPAQVIYPLSPAVVYTGSAIPTFSPLILFGDTPTLYQINNTCLPTGLSLNSTTGEITGTPTTSGQFVSCFVEVSNSGGKTFAELQITVRSSTQFTLDSPTSNSTVSYYQVFSGQCTSGYSISISSSDPFSISQATDNKITCENEEFYVGVHFYGSVNSSRTLQFQQSNQSITRTVLFNPTGFSVPQLGPNDTVNTMAFDSSTGKMYIGGKFTAIEGKPTKYIARLNTDGSLDTSFSPTGTGLNSYVSTIAIDTLTNKIYIGGNFTQYNGSQASYIARLNTDGSLDTSFNPPGSGFNSPVNSIAYDSSIQKVYAGGWFPAVNGETNNPYLVRLNSDGTVDTGFSQTGSGISGTVNAIALDITNQKVYITGWFTNYNGTSRSRIARLNSDGTLDTSFAPTTGLSGLGRSLYYDSTIQKIYVGGDFSSYNSTTRYRIVRINSNGTIDTGFTYTGTGLSSNVYGISVDETNQLIYVAGAFTSYNGTSRYYTARLNSNGTHDTTFNPNGGFSSTTNVVYYDSSNQKIYIGGDFNSFNNTSRNYIAKLNTDGTLNTSYASQIGRLTSLYTNSISIRASAIEPSTGKIYIGGSFTHLNGTSISKIARLNSDGSLDSSFTLSGSGLTTNSTVKSIIYDSINSKIYIGGDFTDYNGTPVYHVARLNSDGTLDTGFLLTGVGLNSSVSSMALDSTNSKLYVAGAFTGYDVSTRKYIARLNLDGSLDTSFTQTGTGLSAAVNSLAFDSTNQKIYVGGSFTNYNSTTRNRIARLNSDGSLDTSFAPTGTGLSGPVNALVYNSTNQKIYVGGSFVGYDTLSASGINVPYLLSLNSDGTWNPDFFVRDGKTPFSFGLSAPVLSLFLDSTNQKLYAGGDFTTLDETSVKGLVRLNLSGLIDNHFKIMGNGFTTNGSSAQVYSITLDSANDKIYVGGLFTEYNYIIQRGLTKLNSDGSISP